MKSELDDFIENVKIISHLKQEKNMYFDFTDNSISIGIEVEGRKKIAEMLKKYNITEKRHKELTTEFLELLFHILMNKKMPPEKYKNLDKKIETIKTLFIDVSIQKKFYFQILTMNNTLSDIKWNISYIENSSLYKGLKKLPIINMQITLRTPNRELKRISMDMSMTDLNKLKDEINLLDSKYKEISKEAD
jgi:uncharacterized UPF0160 family protein